MPLTFSKIIKDEINENINSSVIENLVINFDTEKYAITNDFPSEFSIKFNQFNVEFNIAFSKMSPEEKTYPVKSSDIYVYFNRLFSLKYKQCSR